jgi:hypothetical protein
MLVSRHGLLPTVLVKVQNSSNLTGSLLLPDTPASVCSSVIFGPFIFNIPIDEATYSGQEDDSKDTDTATAAAHTAANSCTGKTAEQHATQHTPREPAGHTPQKASSLLLLGRVGRRCGLLP